MAIVVVVIVVVVVVDVSPSMRLLPAERVEYHNFSSTLAPVFSIHVTNINIFR